MTYFLLGGNNLKPELEQEGFTLWVVGEMT